MLIAAWVDCKSVQRESLIELLNSQIWFCSKFIQSLILSGKNILQELLSRELTTMRLVSFIQNLDNLGGYLYSDRPSPNFLNNEIQSNLNLLRNGSYAAKSIEYSNCKQGRTFSFKQDNPVLTLPCFSLVFWKDSEPYRAFH